MFRSILEQGDYILEDTGRACFIAGMEQADRVVLLEPPPLLRRKRVVARWLRQNLGLEACAYRPTFAGRDGVRTRAAQFPEKLIVLRSKKDIRRWMRGLEH